MINLANAIVHAYGEKAGLTIIGNEIKEWPYEGEIPNAEKLEEIKNAYATYLESIAYQGKRAKAYPSIQEQLDMLYHDKINDTATWVNAIANVKNKYPKS